jgi:hypothetical protein
MKVFRIKGYDDILLTDEQSIWFNIYFENKWDKSHATWDQIVRDEQIEIIDLIVWEP